MSSSTKPPTDRLGLWLFAFYTALYLGFVLINAFAPNRMEAIVFAGLNLAIVYGFGLILAAIVLALVYGLLRRDAIDASSNDRTEADT
ncbi:MAG: DUF485 domain-containing protein [Planctomycetota bacterium]